MKTTKPKSKQSNRPAPKPASLKAAKPEAGARTADVQKQKPAAAHPAVREVALRLHAPAALAVCVAGTFNNWKVGAHPLRTTNGGEWRGELSLPSGRYEYLFVVDGSWIPDPAAGENVPNEFGGLNSVFLVN